MTSIPNDFNLSGDYTMKDGGFVPIQINPNHQSKRVPSVLVTSNNTSNNTNHTFFSLASSHHSQISSSYSRINHSHMVYQMRSSMASSFNMPCPAQSSTSITFSQVSITQTITKRYTSIIPTNNSVTIQNDNERVKRVMTSDPTIRSSTPHLPNIFDKHFETFTPKPIDYFCSQQESPYHQHLERFSSSPKHHNNPYVPRGAPLVKRFYKPVEVLKGDRDYIDYNKYERSEEGESAGWIHKLPYEQEASFICLKCNTLFHTSQILVAHVGLVHCKDEVTEGRKKRRKLNP